MATSRRRACEEARRRENQPQDRARANPPRATNRRAPGNIMPSLSSANSPRQNRAARPDNAALCLPAHEVTRPKVKGNPKMHAARPRGNGSLESARAGVVQVKTTSSLRAGPVRARPTGRPGHPPFPRARCPFITESALRGNRGGGRGDKERSSRPPPSPLFRARKQIVLALRGMGRALETANPRTNGATTWLPTFGEPPSAARDAAPGLVEERKRG
jgi:hypothetical protein